MCICVREGVRGCDNVNCDIAVLWYCGIVRPGVSSKIGCLVVWLFGYQENRNGNYPWI